VPSLAAVAVVAARVGGAWAADHRGRRTDVRVHAGAHAWTRPGRIAVVTGVLAAIEVGLSATLA
jgi:hypothetical protein